MGVCTRTCMHILEIQKNINGCGEKNASKVIHVRKNRTLPESLTSGSVIENPSIHNDTCLPSCIQDTNAHL